MSGLSGLSDEIDAALGAAPPGEDDVQSEATAAAALARHAPNGLAPQQPQVTATQAATANLRSECTHQSVRFGNLCALCGCEIPVNETLEPAIPLNQEQRELIAMRAASTKAKRKAAAIPLVEQTPRRRAEAGADAQLMNVTYMGEMIRISADDAARVGQRTKKALINSRKLMLVLDLDHTLLNSKAEARLESQDREALTEAQAAEASGSESDAAATRTLYHLPHRGLWTKLRPGVHELLSELDSLYDLHVYTMGDRVYAHDMASLLDKSGQMFRNKIISRNDSMSERQKDLRLLLGAEDMVLIVDDTASVWAECSQNIMQVERYHYFPPSPDRNAPPTASLLRQRIDETAQEGQLRRVLDVLKEVHRRFFAANPAAGPDAHHDARSILAEIRREILQGCVLVFSKVIPLAQQRQGSPQHLLWVMATQLGARCSPTLESETTHVVALSTHTDKVQQALREGRHVVHPSWLTSCFYQWRRVDEASFPAPEEGDGVQFMRGLHMADLAAVAAAGGRPAPQLSARQLNM